MASQPLAGVIAQQRDAVAGQGSETGDVDGGAELALDDFRLIEHALSARVPSKWAILQHPEMKGSLVCRRLLTLRAFRRARLGQPALLRCADMWWDVLLKVVARRRPGRL